MKPIYGVCDANVVFEFAKTRGAIHYHMIVYLKGEFQQKLQDILMRLSLKISEIVEKLDAYIEGVWDPERHSGKKNQYNLFLKAW